MFSYILGRSVDIQDINEMQGRHEGETKDLKHKKWTNECPNLVVESWWARIRRLPRLCEKHRINGLMYLLSFSALYSVFILLATFTHWSRERPSGFFPTQWPYLVITPIVINVHRAVLSFAMVSRFISGPNWCNCTFIVHLVDCKIEQSSFASTVHPQWPLYPNMSVNSCAPYFTPNNKIQNISKLHGMRLGISSSMNLSAKRKNIAYVLRPRFAQRLKPIRDTLISSCILRRVLALLFKISGLPGAQ